jgi:hypothetical protein
LFMRRRDKLSSPRSPLRQQVGFCAEADEWGIEGNVEGNCWDLKECRGTRKISHSSPLANGGGYLFTFVSLEIDKQTKCSSSLKLNSIIRE